MCLPAGRALPFDEGVIGVVAGRLTLVCAALRQLFASVASGGLRCRLRRGGRKSIEYRFAGRGYAVASSS
jgi:hypothetical protein